MLRPDFFQQPDPITLIRPRGRDDDIERSFGKFQESIGTSTCRYDMEIPASLKERPARVKELWVAINTEDRDHAGLPSGDMANS